MCPAPSAPDVDPTGRSGSGLQVAKAARVPCCRTEPAADLLSVGLPPKSCSDHEAVSAHAKAGRSVKVLNYYSI